MCVLLLFFVGECFGSKFYEFIHVDVQSEQEINIPTEKEGWYLLEVNRMRYFCDISHLLLTKGILQQNIEIYYLDISETNLG